MIYIGGLIFIKCCAMFTGLIVYAKYEHCDPIKAEIVQKTDQVREIAMNDLFNIKFMITRFYHFL